MKFLLLYSSRFGHTRKIAQTLQSQWQNAGITVILQDLRTMPAPDRQEYDCIIIGASIRYGHYAAQLTQWVKQHQAILQHTPSAFFSVSILARKPNRNTPQTHSYTRKFLEKTHWQPQQIGIFAGELHYARYNLIDRYLMKMVMWLNKGETDLHSHIEFTDWAQVQHFGTAVLKLLPAHSA